MKKIIKFTVSLVVGLSIGLIIGILVGMMITGKGAGDIIGVLRDIDAGSIMESTAVSLAAFVTAATLQIVIHEGGHLVGGLLSGYRFVSFRIFNIALIRHKGRFALRRYSIAGTGGQCLLLPPDGNADDIPLMLYNGGGIAANIIMVATAAALLIFCDGINAAIIVLLIFLILLGIFFGLLNGIPMKVGGITNDGYNMLLFRRSKLSRMLFVNQLRVNAMIQDGMRPKDIPEELFAISGVDDPTDVMQGSAIIIHATRLLDMGDTEGAYNMLAGVMKKKEKMVKLLANEAQCELLFVSLMLGRTEEARTLYTEDLKKYIMTYSKIMSSKQRILHAVALFLDNDAAEARRIYDKLEANRSGYMMQGEVAMDLVLMKKAEECAEKRANGQCIAG